MNLSKFLTIGALGLVLLVAVLMTGCPSTKSGGYSNKDVQYTISGDRISNNADNDYPYYIPGPGTNYEQLTWYCGNYNGHQRSKVVLTFKESNGTWVLDKEEYGSGSCG